MIGATTRRDTPITREVIGAALRYVVREMRTILIRSSYSPILYETHDLSCCLTNRTGDIIALHVDVPMHIFPVLVSVPRLLEEYEDDIRPGDIFICNDPWTAGTHMNDIQLLKPIFIDGELELFAAVRAHHGDVGGTTPGSISGASTEIFHEGIRLPMAPFVREGEVQNELMKILLANVRQPFETQGVLRSQIAACDVATTRVQSIYERFGPELVGAALDRNLVESAARLGEAISALPDGEVFFEDYLENSGSAPQNRKIIYLRSRMTVTGDKIEVDFTDCSPQRAGVGNAERADTWCGVFTALATMLDDGLVTTTGGVRQMNVVTTPGTVVDSQYPGPVGGFADLQNGIIQGSCVGLLSQLMPDGVCAPTGSSCNQLFFGGPANPRRGNEPWFMFEFAFGGWSALDDHDGNLAIPQWFLGDIPMYWPVERIELLNPLRVLVNDIRPDSGGPGRSRGGVGVQRAWEVLAPMSMSFLGSDGILPRPGTFEGSAGALNEILVLRDGEVIVPGDIPLKLAGFPLETGDIVVMLVAGGGGYGDALDRPVEKVVEDLDDGYISIAGARDDYGVVLDGDEVDASATEAARQRLREQRALLRPLLTEQDEYDADGRRIARVSPAAAARLGLADGDIVEYVPSVGTGLRAWLAVDEELPDDAVAIGPRGAQMVKAGAEGLLWIRSPWSYGASETVRQEICDHIAGLATVGLVEGATA